jgi:Protein of unknown function (DUF3179)
MYDHQTESLWHNLTGEPVVGSLAQSGIKLKVLPVVITSWEHWLRDHPETVVLDINTGHQRDYTPGQPYGNYFASPTTMFPVSPRNTRLPPKSYVFALQVKGSPKAYPMDILGAKTVLNDTLGGVNLVIVADATTRTARAYERGTHTFSPGTSPGTVMDTKSGTAWQVKEEHLADPDGKEKLPRLGGHVSFWFGWYAFYPATEVYAPGDSQ